MSSKTFHQNVMERYMSPEEISSFIEKYQANRSWIRVARPVNDQDREIFKDFKAKMSMKDLSAKYSFSIGKIQTSILKAAQE